MSSASAAPQDRPDDDQDFNPALDPDYDFDPQVRMTHGEKMAGHKGEDPHNGHSFLAEVAAPVSGDDYVETADIFGDLEDDESTAEADGEGTTPSDRQRVEDEAHTIKKRARLVVEGKNLRLNNMANMAEVARLLETARNSTNIIVAYKTLIDAYKKRVEFTFNTTVTLPDKSILRPFAFPFSLMRDSIKEFSVLNEAGNFDANSAVQAITKISRSEKFDPISPRKFDSIEFEKNFLVVFAELLTREYEDEDKKSFIPKVLDKCLEIGHKLLYAK